jgi:hypothetical protein
MTRAEQVARTVWVQERMGLIADAARYLLGCDVVLIAHDAQGHVAAVVATGGDNDATQRACFSAASAYETGSLPGADV